MYIEMKSQIDFAYVHDIVSMCLFTQKNFIECVILDLDCYLTNHFIIKHQFVIVLNESIDAMEKISLFAKKSLFSFDIHFC